MLQIDVLAKDTNVRAAASSAAVTSAPMTSSCMPDSNPMIHADFNNSFSGLLNGSNFEINDIVIMMQQMHNQLLSVIAEQNKTTQRMLNELKASQDGVIAKLQSEIIVLRDEVEALKSSQGKPDKSHNGINVLTEVQDRATRASNVMVYNVKESKSNDVEVRINHDKEKLQEVFAQIGIDAGLFKAIRVGKATADRARPLKVMLSSSEIARSCLINKPKLKGSEIRIGPDLTIAQREYCSEVHKELSERLAAGENDLIIRYEHGVPHITKRRLVRADNAKND